MNPIKRVPLDFAHPLRTPWPGYQNPYSRPCPKTGKTCFGGVSNDRKWLETVARTLSLAGSPRMNDQGTHPILREVYGAPELPPGPEFADFVAKLTGEPPSDYPSDYSIQRALLRAARLPEKWGWCPVCHGEARDPSCREEREAWRPTEPPTGPGYQLWTGGWDNAPQATSPVFETLSDLLAFVLANRLFRAREGDDFVIFELTMHARALGDDDVGELRWSYSATTFPVSSIRLFYRRHEITAERSETCAGAWAWAVKGTSFGREESSLLEAVDAGMAAVRAMKDAGGEV